MASEDEIFEALSVAKEAGATQILLFHCISSYPAPIDQANLKQMRALKDKFKVCIGLSDHTIGNTAAITATALGASAIEKHFTLCRNEKGPDSEFSIEPSELKERSHGMTEALRPKASGYSRGSHATSALKRPKRCTCSEKGGTTW